MSPEREQPEKHGPGAADDGEPHADTAPQGRLDRHAQELGRRIWITRGARLNAYRRLTVANDWSLRAITFLSMYSIVAALAVAVPQFGLTAAQKEMAGVALTALSVFTLVVSLLEAPRNYVLRAERLHRNALDLGALVDRLNLLRTRTTDAAALGEGLQRMGAEYATILSSCPENHEPADDALFRAQHRKDFGVGPFTAWWTSAVTSRRSYLVYYAFVWLPVIAVAAGLRCARAG